MAEGDADQRYKLVAGAGFLILKTDHFPLVITRPQLQKFARVLGNHLTLVGPT